jgi:GYF domain 2
MNYFLWVTGKEQGPYTIEQLRNAVADGTIDRHQTARTEDGTEWEPLQEIAHLTKPRPQPTHKPRAQQTEFTTPKKPVNAQPRNKALLISCVGLAAGVCILGSALVAYKVRSDKVVAELRSKDLAATEQRTGHATLNRPVTDDPVSELRRNIDALSSSPPKEIVPGNGILTSYTGISYDIQKSDSVLNPLVAVITGKQHNQWPEGTREETYVVEFTLTAAYRDGRWSFQKMSGTVDFLNGHRYPIDEKEQDLLALPWSTFLRLALKLKSKHNQ